ncbi:MAG: immunity 17 family protein [Planctomyces sp.]|nr:immunity 17 family protein [Planctomyces sp.]
MKNPAGLILVSAGVFSILGGVFGWEFFINSGKAKLFVHLFGRTGARLFYVLLGLFIVVFGTLITMGIVQEEA